MSNSIFEQLHVGTVSNLACFGIINEEAVGLHHISALGQQHQAPLGQPAHEQPLVNKIELFAGRHHESRTIHKT
jgi:hypothetical protein